MNHRTSGGANLGYLVSLGLPSLGYLASPIVLAPPIILANLGYLATTLICGVFSLKQRCVRNVEKCKKSLDSRCSLV